MGTRLEQFVAEVESTLNDETVSHYVGGEYLEQHQPGRRVVWVPGRSPFEPPRRTAGTMVNGERVTDAALRVENVSAFVAAVTMKTVTHKQATEELFDLLVAALKITGSASVALKGYDWLSEGVKVRGTTLRCAHMQLDFELRLPVIEKVEPCQVAIGVATSVSFVDPDGNAQVQIQEPTFLTYNGIPLSYDP